MFLRTLSRNLTVASAAFVFSASAFAQKPRPATFAALVEQIAGTGNGFLQASGKTPDGKTCEFSIGSLETGGRAAPGVALNFYENGNDSYSFAARSEDVTYEFDAAGNGPIAAHVPISVNSPGGVVRYDLVRIEFAAPGEYSEVSSVFGLRRISDSRSGALCLSEM